MKERPILFSSEMVRAILEGRKTQTRRVVKSLVSINHSGLSHDPMVLHDGDWIKPNEWSPYGQPGDRLWVRETWGLTPELDLQLLKDDLTPIDISIDDAQHVGYKADCSGANAVTKWRPSIYMPRWASRIMLEIVSVRVERVQDANAESYIEEGIHVSMYEPAGKSTGNPEEAAFKTLWDSINAKRGYSWDSNPWVWVIEFKVVEESA